MSPGYGRPVEVPPERWAGWLARFEARHGAITLTRVGPDRVVISAADGTTALANVPFPPWDPEDRLTDHVLRGRRVGLVLIRRGGFAAGVADGDRLLVGRTGTRRVQSRAAAGGWSQQRFARRRDQQTGQLLDAAAGLAADVLLTADGLDAVVTGGDRLLLRRLLDDPRLAPIRALVVHRVLDVPDPRAAVLEAAVGRARALVVRVDNPG